jgi:hypothetical protein
MTVAEIIEELNESGFTDTGTPDKLKKINATIWDIASREPWPFLETTTTLTFDGTSAVPTNLPADFRAALSVIDTTTGRAIQPERVEVVEKQWPLELSEIGAPFVYYFVGRGMYLARIPTADTTLRMRYLTVPTAVTDASLEADIIIPPQHHSAIVLGSLVKLYDQEDDPELSVRFEGHYENKIQNMRAEQFMRQFDRPERVHVVEDDDWF